MADNGGDLSLANSSNWLRAIESYLKVTEESSLNLGLEVGIEEVKSILKSLRNSQIKQLNIEGSNLNGKVEELSQFLVQTQVTTLGLKKCQLSVSDFVHLMNILTDTQTTDLNVSGNEIELDENTANGLIAPLRKSHLTSLNLDDNIFPQNGSVLFLKALTTTSITHLNLWHVFRSRESASAIGALFSSLKHSALKVLKIPCNNIKSADLQELGESLRDSKLEELDLSFNEIEDAGINFLFKALEHSRVVDLGLRWNLIRGCNNLGLHLKNTAVKILDLNSNNICEVEMFSFPDFVRGSAVESLDLENCKLGHKQGPGVNCFLFNSAPRELPRCLVDLLPVHLNGLKGVC